MTGLLRFTLTRILEAGNPRACGFVMLNPSTADDEIDDPTIRRCVAFAKREGCGRLEVANIIPARSTDPRRIPALLRWTPEGTEEQNAEHLAAMLSSVAASGGPVIVGWGSHGDRVPTEVRRFVAIAAALKVPLWCLGTTKSGQPRHPLYVRGDQLLERWEVDR